MFCLVKKIHPKKYNRCITHVSNRGKFRDSTERAHFIWDRGFSPLFGIMTCPTVKGFRQPK